MRLRPRASQQCSTTPASADRRVPCYGGPIRVHDRLCGASEAVGPHGAAAGTMGVEECYQELEAYDGQESELADEERSAGSGAPRDRAMASASVRSPMPLPAQARATACWSVALHVVSACRDWVGTDWPPIHPAFRYRVRFSSSFSIWELRFRPKACPNLVFEEQERVSSVTASALEPTRATATQGREKSRDPTTLAQTPGAGIL